MRVGLIVLAGLPSVERYSYLNASSASRMRTTVFLLVLAFGLVAHAQPFDGTPGALSPAIPAFTGSHLCSQTQHGAL